jgi:hypothetical protein
MLIEMIHDCETVTLGLIAAGDAASYVCFAQHYTFIVMTDDVHLIYLSCKLKQLPTEVLQVAAAEAMLIPASLTRAQISSARLSANDLPTECMLKAWHL